MVAAVAVAGADGGGQRRGQATACDRLVGATVPDERVGTRAHDDVTSATASGVQVAATGRVITWAALVMGRVAAGLAASTDVVVTMLAVGLAASEPIGATMLALVLVPAAIGLLGPSWRLLAHWLGRVLPHVEAEGTDWSDGGGRRRAAPEARSSAP
jgi:hypothetical protein